jgi:hypothetical protein
MSMRWQAGTFVCCLVACNGKDNGKQTDWSCDGASDVEVCTAEATSDGDGVIEATVPIDGERAFLVTGVADESSTVAVASLFDPDDKKIVDWYDWVIGDEADESLTYAFFVANDTVFNWPIREVDGSPDSGVYTIELGTYDTAKEPHVASGVPVALTLHKNHGSGYTGGTVHALIVYADGLGDDPVVTKGTEAAVEVWREVWAAFGITLDEEFVSSDIDPSLPWPGTGGPAMESAASQGDGTQVIVIVGDTIDGGLKYLGVSGNIPGTLVPTERTGTAVSWLANAGTDGEFDDVEIQIYGETLAHEVGHYVGLFHPVESTYDLWDALDDTEKCTNESQCEDDLGSNLMFPWPVCSFSGCVSQNQLTPEQQGVMHRYSGVY